jgi:hypothetical protein
MLEAANAASVQLTVYSYVRSEVDIFLSTYINPAHILFNTEFWESFCVSLCPQLYWHKQFTTAYCGTCYQSAAMTCITHKVMIYSSTYCLHWTIYTASSCTTAWRVIKGNGVLYQAQCGPEGSRRFRLPDSMTFGTWRWWSCQPDAPAAFTPRKCSWYSFSLGAELTPGPGHGQNEVRHWKIQWHHQQSIPGLSD